MEVILKLITELKKASNPVLLTIGFLKMPIRLHISSAKSMEMT
jgi:hypothetical protein